MNNEKTVFKFKNNFKHFKIFLVLLIIIIIIIAIFFIINQNKNNDKDKKILYTINYNGLDCPTPTLVLYDNYTYAYHYTFTTDNKKTTPKTGKYNYNIDNIIKNIDNNKQPQQSTYIITDKHNNTYLTSNNQELNNFLKSININLITCLTQE